MKFKIKQVVTSAFLCLAVHGICRAADWPEYRGPNHDGSSPEKILTSWPASGLRPLWRVPLTDGFSSFAVASGKAFTLVQREVEGAQQEVCVALNAETGKELWAQPLGIAKYDNGGNSGAPDNKGGDGPRSTPAADGGKVYTLSGRLLLQCRDAESGKVLWSHNLVTENQAHVIMWQNAASPVIDGGLVFVIGGGPGQAILAYDKADGHVVWKCNNDKMTHSTPTVATIMGVRQIIFYAQSGLVALETKTGRTLWRYPFPYHVSSAMTPIVYKNIVYCSAGYGAGAGACRITKSGENFSAAQAWYQPANVLNNHWSTPVCKDGFLYGIYGFKEFARAPLKCVDIATGNILWSKEGFGPGGCVLVDGNVLVLSDAGDLILVKAQPSGFAEIARTHAVSGKCWSTPCISNGHIFARSTKEGACFDVSSQLTSR